MDILHEASVKVGERLGRSPELVSMVLKWYWKHAEHCIRSGDYERFYVGSVFVLCVRYRKVLHKYVNSYMKESTKEWYYDKLLRSTKKTISGIEFDIECIRYARKLSMERKNLIENIKQT